MGKKALRRQVAALQHRADALTKREAALVTERDLLGDALLDAGLLRIGTPRTEEDQLRAARAGVLVLADVGIIDAQTTLEQEALATSALYGAVRTIPGRTTAFATIKITADPRLIEELGVYIHSRP